MLYGGRGGNMRTRLIRIGIIMLMADAVYGCAVSDGTAAVISAMSFMKLWKEEGISLQTLLSVSGISAQRRKPPLIS